MSRILAGVFIAFAFVVCGAAAPAGAQSDADFLAARAAFERGDAARLDALAPKLAGHLLAPYVEYWQLQAAASTRRPATTKSGGSSRAGRKRRSPTGCAWNG